MRKILKRTLACALAVIFLCSKPVVYDAYSADDNEMLHIKFEVTVVDNWSNPSGYSWFEIYYKDKSGQDKCQTIEQEKGFWNIIGHVTVFDIYIDSDYTGYNSESTYLRIEQFTKMNTGRSLEYNEAVISIGSGLTFHVNDYNNAIAGSESINIFDSDKISMQKEFPDGYDFNRDRYSFENLDETIDCKYYQSGFGLLKGYIIYRQQENGSKHGHCFGMAHSTAAILQICPNVSTFSASNLIDVSSNSYNNSLLMSAREYIKYAHIYQFTDSVAVARDINTGATNVLNAVKKYVIYGGAPVLIDMWASFGGHTVYAIGVDETDILVNDSNEPNNITRIKTNGDKWEYTAGGWHWNSANGDTIDYVTDTTTLYSCLQADLNDSLFSHHKLLVRGSDSLSYKQSEDMLQIRETTTTESNDETTEKIFWLNNGNTINVKNDRNETASVELVGNELLISAAIPEASAAEIVIDENKNNEITISTKDNEVIEFTFTTVDGTNNGFIDIDVSAVSSSDTITATQTETGLVVTGISDGTVTLSKDDEVIETQEISNATSDIEISYDKTGENEDVSLDYEHSHTDQDADGKCDICGETLEAVESCPHICHKTGFSAFVWKILRLFCKLFGINQTCSCGVKHY